ncbi:MAG: glycoside hydrolase family 28 protein [Clostridia bacterium]|nr:glycoside hydrolase family 28 protein [Clostridia bacterium]
MQSLYVSSRSCTVLLDPQGFHEASQPRDLYLNGMHLGMEQRSVATLFHLEPDTEYTLSALVNDSSESLAFRTLPERISLDVRRFGAVGDGSHDDTPHIQSAILACPHGGRVRIPAGTYRTGPLFLKSHITLEIQKDAVLKLRTDRESFPILPGVTFSDYDREDYLLGSWEGNPLDCYAGAITGLGVEDVTILGEGIIDGCGPDGDWWIQPKIRRGAWRPRLFYTRDCKDIRLIGLTFRNSPSWNLHPTFSENLDFLNLRVEAPYHSPNTDGFDPESCRNIRMMGTVFSVGDDCVAIKSGKIYMGRTYQTPCENIEIAYSAMLHGHGGVTIGSEMAGGVRNVRVHHCLMDGNDRGLRIKTRRGRGQNGIIDNIVFEDISMKHVSAPLTANAFYFCDPDGRSEYVQSREKKPKDASTPCLGRIAFHRVHAEDCGACLAWVLGLPEAPMQVLEMHDCHFTMAENAVPMAPVMAEGVEEVTSRGVHAENVLHLDLKHNTVASPKPIPCLLETVGVEDAECSPEDLQQI